MRIAILTLALFCALISGWTAALAQVQDLGGSTISHHESAVTHHPATADHACKDASCSPQPKMVHPMSCSACFAVILDAHGIDRVELPAGRVRPALQRPMLAAILKPRFPPPKTVLSFS